MGLTLQHTCKTVQFDIYPSICPSSTAHGWHSRGKQGFLVQHAFLSSSAHMNTHLDKKNTHIHTPPARPPGLDDLLNSSNYQALTDRQIRFEQGCWSLRRQTESKGRETEKTVRDCIKAPDIHSQRVGDRERGMGEKNSQENSVINYIELCLHEDFIKPNHGGD